MVEIVADPEPTAKPNTETVDDVLEVNFVSPSILEIENVGS